MLKNIALLLVFVAPFTMASDVNELSYKLSLNKNITASFKQYRKEDSANKREASQGELWLYGNDKFKWITTSPFPQEIISNGKKLWVYDPDLEQLTIRNIDDKNIISPARIIGGSIKDLNENFKVDKITDKVNSSIYQLSPRYDETTEFSRLRIMFKNNIISQIMINDELGGESILIFSDIEKIKDLENDFFEFTPPDFTDIIEVK